MNGKWSSKGVLQLSNFDPQQRSLQRVMLGYATECELDSAGRILISSLLRQHAKLEKGLMLVGQLNRDSRSGARSNSKLKLKKTWHWVPVVNLHCRKH